MAGEKFSTLCTAEQIFWPALGSKASCKDAFTPFDVSASGEKFKAIDYRRIQGGMYASICRTSRIKDASSVFSFSFDSSLNFFSSWKDLQRV